MTTYSGNIKVTFGESLLDYVTFNSKEVHDKMLAYFKENRSWCVIEVTFFSNE